MVTKEQIIELLQNNDKAVVRALIVLNERQTADEQANEETKFQNGRGFRPCHARMGTSMAKFYIRNQYLTPKQLAYWRALDKSGKMRIAIYAGQLLQVAIAKQSNN
jgi:tRNA(Ile2) C34 agmatinyltransferase TiaS